MSYSFHDLENICDALLYYVEHRLPGFEDFESTYYKVLYQTEYGI